jgi:hypothetical protein
MQLIQFVCDDTEIDQSRNNKVLRHWSVAIVYKFPERKKKSLLFSEKE